MIAKRYRERDREKMLRRMYSDWNIFENTERIRIILVRRKSNLLFAQHEESMQLLLDQGFKDVEDAKSYRTYLEKIDRELNILRQHIYYQMDYFSVYEDKMKVILDYLSTSGQSPLDFMKTFGQIGQRSEEKTFGQIGQRSEAETSGQLDQKLIAMDAYLQLRSVGVSPVRLYRMQKRAEVLVDKIESFKRHIFVNKKIVDRIIRDGNKQQKEQEILQSKGGRNHE